VPARYSCWVRPSTPFPSRSFKFTKNLRGLDV